jgi:CheY-like chemotaxis protein
MKQDNNSKQSESNEILPLLHNLEESLDTLHKYSNEPDFALIINKMRSDIQKSRLLTEKKNNVVEQDSFTSRKITMKNAPTIMVVDDEEMVLQVTCIIISKMGFRPLAFSNSIKALEYYKENYQRISLVLLDMIMPGMNGKELFLAMKEIHSPIKAMLLSGWIDKEETTNINEIGLVNFLHKPIEKSVLETNILQALKL